MKDQQECELTETATGDDKTLRFDVGNKQRVVGLFFLCVSSSGFTSVTRSH